jgi:tetratricopeptide (TPR) repeat protein
MISSTPIAGNLSYWRRATILLALILGTWLVFGQTVSHDFVSYDDSGYVYQNELVSRGLTVTGLKAAFLQPHARNWHPLTTISHMVDCQLFGLEPGGHHLVSVILHIAAVLLLFEILGRTTAAPWRAAMVAALFAIHPLRAESVAWIAERKDVLSAFFFMLALGAYVSYARRPSTGRYLVTCLLLGLGLMAKPMLVTLPLLFLLLDYWPLGRFGTSAADGNRTKLPAPRLLLEKIPMLALAAGSAAATLLAQRYTVGYGATLPLYWRAGNSLCSIFIYIGQMFWPTRLAAFYPYPAHPLSWWVFGLLFCALIGLTMTAFALRKSRPWILVGWLWYLIALVPVVGVVQVGLQAHADRYTYLPQIGLYLIVAWEAARVARSTQSARFVVATATAIALLTLARLAWWQTATWKNTETLWTHAAAVNPKNVVAHYSVGSLRLENGDVEGAIFHYQQALKFASIDAVEVGQPHVGYLHNSLGNALLAKGDLSGAAREYRQAAEMKPDFADAHSNLGATFARRGEIDEAIREYKIALSIPPEDAESHLALGLLFLRKGQSADAIAHFDRAVALEPRSKAALTALANALVTIPDPALRNPRRGLELAQRAAQLTRTPDLAALRIAAAARAQLPQK